MAAATAANSYLIVGAGCFGASTARYLKTTYPDADVVIVDSAPFPNPVAASHDLNKIIRAEYEDIMYMRLAVEALDAWSADPVLRPSFHKTGVVWGVTPTRARELVDGYEEILGPGGSPVELLGVDEARARFPLLRQCALQGASNCLWNPNAGWGDAASALEAVIQDAVDLGVRYEVATVARVDLDDANVCTGVTTEDGRTFRAEHVILCLGAYTPWLLAASAPDRPSIHAGGRMVAAAALLCAFDIDPGEGYKFQGAPIIVHPLGDISAECIPPGSSGGRDLVKVTHQYVYTHNVYHDASKQQISVPPSKMALKTWSQDIPDALKSKSVAAQTMMFKDSIMGMVPKAYRLCWDSATPSDDWIISPHPSSKNLYIATGGSFHGWKFLPIIGKYITQMLKGELSAQHAERWAWDRDVPPVRTVYTPRMDLKDVPGWV